MKWHIGIKKDFLLAEEILHPRVYYNAKKLLPN
jgi:hypothetical protein